MTSDLDPALLERARARTEILSCVHAFCVYSEGCDCAEKIARFAAEEVERALANHNMKLFPDLARARLDGAIEALADPDEAMLNAARDWSAKEYGKPIGSDAARGCWSAMRQPRLAQLKKERGDGP